jgi:DNA-3-methyladenine glycosylase II
VAAVTASRGSFALEAQGPFNLAAAARFGAGFSPSPMTRSDTGMRFGLALERDGWRSVGVELTPAPGGVRGRVVLADGSPAPKGATEAARGQVARMLSLDVDGEAFPAIGEGDPVAGRLQSRYPGLRPVLFGSPYDAAAWAIIGRRVRMRQAANVRARLAEELGTPVSIGPDTFSVFPEPSRLTRLEAPWRGLTEGKIGELRALGEATLAGDLDAAALREQPEDEALAALQRPPGIGPFSAELILVRGAGAPDVFPRHERRLRQAMASAYGLSDDPKEAEPAEIAERWRPYRSWVALLLRAWLADEGSTSPP